jgi:hypothetical protein
METAEEIILKQTENLNRLKQALIMTGKPFTKEQIKTGLKGAGMKYTNNFMQCFMNSGQFESVKKGLYKFKYEGPIHKDFVIELQKRYKKLCNQYSQNARLKKEAACAKTSETVTVKEPVTEQVDSSEIEKAIALLKENGYIILKPIEIICEEV